MSGGDTDKERSGRRGPGKYFLMLLVMAAAFSVYSGTLSHGFVWDDRYELFQNPWIRSFEALPLIFTSHSLAWLSTEKASAQYHPLKLLLRMAQYRFFETDPVGYHLTNALAHAVSAGLLFLLSLSLFRDCCGETGLVFPTAASLLFAVHPVNTEAVNWVSAIPELFMSLFCLLSFYTFLQNDAGLKKNRIICGLFFFIALLFKPSALFFAVLFPLYDVLLKKGPFDGEGKGGKFKEALLRYGPFAFFAAAYLVLYRIAVGGAVAAKEGFVKIGFGQWVLNLPSLLMKYLQLLLFPSDLKALYVFHPVPSMTDIAFILPAIGAAVLLFLIYILWKKNKVLSFGLLWIIAPLLLPLYLPLAGYSFYAFAERYLYLSSAGFSLSVSILARWVYRGRVLKAFTGPVISGAFCLIMLYCVTATLSRNLVWDDDYSLWSDTVAKSPDSSVAHSNLGSEYLNKRLYDEALREYDAALALNPYNWDAFVNRQKLNSYRQQRLIQKRP